MEKGECQNGCDKNKHLETSEKQIPPDAPCTCASGSKICSFSGQFGVLSFFVTPVLIFALLPYYWRYALYVITI